MLLARNTPEAVELRETLLLYLTICSWGAIQATMTFKMAVSLHQFRWFINRAEGCSDEAFSMRSSYNFRSPDCNRSACRAITFFLKPPACPPRIGTTSPHQGRHI